MFYGICSVLFVAMKPKMRRQQFVTFWQSGQKIQSCASEGEKAGERFRDGRAFSKFVELGNMWLEVDLFDQHLKSHKIPHSYFPFQSTKIPKSISQTHVTCLIISQLMRNRTHIVMHLGKVFPISDNPRQVPADLTKVAWKLKCRLTFSWVWWRRPSIGGWPHWWWWAQPTACFGCF